MLQKKGELPIQEKGPNSNTAPLRSRWRKGHGTHLPHELCPWEGTQRRTEIKLGKDSPWEAYIVGALPLEFY